MPTQAGLGKRVRRVRPWWTSFVGCCEFNSLLWWCSGVAWGVAVERMGQRATVRLPEWTSGDSAEVRVKVFSRVHMDDHVVMT